MKRFVILVMLFSAVNCLLFAQTDDKLMSDIRNTGYVHSPLPLDHSKSFETYGLTKKAQTSVMLADMEDIRKWSHSGLGGMYQTSREALQESTALSWLPQLLLTVFRQEE